MNRLMTGLYLMIFLLLSGNAFAEYIEAPKHMVGTLECKVLPHSGLNLLIHSSKDIRCEFTSKDKRVVEYYKGETGIKFGIDIGFGKHENITYAVLSRNFKQGKHQLAGKYSGASGNATLGLSAGDSAPIEKDDKSVSLQPVQVKTSGAGATAGFSYMYLEADSKR
ncbi:MAG: DUF992 domain-containing protein [Mariprofundaceae bacterium]|nr:DUF992 domain-containing protein [Mariprofundaceae bacterium]